jgi:hypothetical protein
MMSFAAVQTNTESNEDALIARGLYMFSTAVATCYDFKLSDMCTNTTAICPVSRRYVGSISIMIGDTSVNGGV